MTCRIQVVRPQLFNVKPSNTCQMKVGGSKVACANITQDKTSTYLCIFTSESSGVGKNIELIFVKITVENEMANVI